MRILKFFVILGGLALIVGYAVLLQRFMGQPAATPAAPAAVAVTTLDLPLESRVASITPHGDGSALLVEGAAGQEVILLDKKGNLLKRLPVAQRPAPPPATP